MNGVLKNRIAKICQHTGLNWVAALPLALMACRSSELRDLHLTPHELVTGRRMPTPCWRTSGKGPSLALLEDEMRAYVNYLAILHKRISTYVSDRQRQEEAQQKLDEQRSSTVQPGDKVFVKVLRRKWFHERRQVPFEVVRSTGTVIQVKGSPTWYHLSHCVKSQNEGISRARTRLPSISEGNEADVHNDPEGLHQVEDVGAAVDTSIGVGNDTPEQQQGPNFEIVNFQHLPDTESPEPLPRTSQEVSASHTQGRTRPTTRSTTRNTITCTIGNTQSRSARTRNRPGGYRTRSKSNLWDCGFTSL